MESKVIKVIVISIVLLLFCVFIYFKTKRDNSKIKNNLKLVDDKKKEKEKEKIRLKEVDEEKYNLLIQEEDKLKEIKKLKNKIWKECRKGLFIFAFIHFIFEIVSESDRTYILMVAVNYQISKYFIRKQIFNKNPYLTKNPIAFSIGISLIVFCFRLLLGFLWTFYKTI
tara:strand:- start:1269 stop:1775 length:507 start_codon:yes stop_codon:yes gene_type:complete